MIDKETLWKSQRLSCAEIFDISYQLILNRL